MPTPTHTLIEAVTLASSASSVTFSSISQDYGDLVLVVRNLGTTYRLYVRFNSDTGANYSGLYAEGNGSGTGGEAYSAFTYMKTEAYWVISNAEILKLDIADYSAINKQKSVLVRLDSSSSGTVMGANRWASTAAINAVQVFASTGTIAAGSTFYLYGIAKAL